MSTVLTCALLRMNRLVLSLKSNDIDGIKKTQSKFPPNFAVEFLFDTPE